MFQDFVSSLSRFEAIYFALMAADVCEYLNNKKISSSIFILCNSEIHVLLFS